MASKKIKVPHGHVLMKHEDPNIGCSVANVVDGFAVVPQAQVEELRAHGFVVDGENAEADVAPEEAAAAAAAEQKADA
jgi:hypothetical protein